MIAFAELMDQIARCLPEGGDWCDLEKAQTLASIVVGFRPRVVCEIGVWMGGSLVPMMLALRAVESAERDARARYPDRSVASTTRAGAVRVIAIDPWSAPASCDGQGGLDAAWWGSVDHDAALQTFKTRMSKYGLTELCEIVRARSDDAPVPPAIDLLHVDGNHADPAFRDVDRFAPSVRMGGVLVLDDVQWTGGHVARARQRARELGFEELYPLGVGIVLQRVRA